MMNHPADQRIFEPDVAAGLLGFKPLVFENFLALGQKRAIQRRSRQKAGIACLIRQIIGLDENAHTIFMRHHDRDFSRNTVPLAHTMQPELMPSIMPKEYSQANQFQHL